jgi:phage RecT family recombinase
VSEPTNYEVIKSHLVAGGTVKSLNRILGSERGKGYAESVLAEIKKSEGGKNDLTKCNYESVIFCMRDAAKLRLGIDGRQHAHLIARWNKEKKEHECCLQIGYRGYLARLQESLPGFSAQVECVYKGEKCAIRRNGFLELVEHERLDAFGDRKDADIVGVYAQLSYDAGTERVSHVVAMNRAEIDKIRGKAQNDSFWSSWFSEKAKVACIRRACKMHFSAVTHDLDAADNDNYDQTAAAKEAAADKADSINSRLTGEMKVVSDEKAA